MPYPKGYFLFPINPNQQNYLAGGMGDLRADHFHAGIDIKTQGREGLPVYATGDGYISEIRVQTLGYGNVIFITHPNGYISVYGHLKEFAEPFASYVKKKRLAQQTFEIKLTPEKDEFKISRGQIIGTSGNTGGSMGPHLHFEIRDLSNNILNPLNFGFSEIKDNTPPIFQQLFLKSLNTNARINGEFGKKSFYPIRKPDGTYQIDTPISGIGTLGIELLAIDKMNGTHNSNGLTCAELLVDGKEVYYYHLEQFPNAISHDINIHTDYAYEKTTGKRIQKLFQDDGNTELPLYKPSVSKGKIMLEDGKTHQISIRIWDAYENGSVLNFTIIGEKSQQSLTVKPNILPLVMNWTVDDNTLMIKARNLKTINSTATLNFGKSTIELPISYVKNNEAVYLWELKRGLPNSVVIDSTQKILSLRQMIVPIEENKLDIDNLSIIFEENTLYDTLYLSTNMVGNLLEIGQATIPLKKAIAITYKPVLKPILPDKTSVYYTYKNEHKFLGGEWDGDEIEFNTKALGQFQLLTDSIPPRAVLVRKSPDYFGIRIGDNLSGLKSFKAFINDEYVLTDYDSKKSLIWSVKADSTQKFIGTMRLELEDNQGNKSIFQTEIPAFTAPPTVPKVKKSAKKVKTFVPKKKKSIKI